MFKDLFAMCKAGYRVLKLETNILKKGGSLDPFNDGKYIRWYYRIGEDGKKVFVPKINVSGLSDDEIIKCAPKGCKLYQD